LSLQGTATPALEARWLHVSQLRCQEAGAQRSERYESTPTYEINKFDELIEHNLVHPNVVKAITEGMGHHTMTQVQSMTINQALQGTDM
jgi:ATP-dependent RNA helicase MSS116